MKNDTEWAGPQPVSESTVLEACGSDTVPKMAHIRQLWETNPIPENEIEARASDAVGELSFNDVPDGGEVAVGAGSRGIANIPRIVSGVVAGLRKRGYEPFVFPAMGSHGGATAEGQREMLESLGIVEDAVNCEIRATMDTVVIGETPDRGVPVHADANAAAADAIVPVNRVKPHTDFDGDVESGLSKMLVIGMGKQRGAKTAHSWAADWSFRNMLPEIASLLIEELPIAGGIATVEDEHDDTAVLEGVKPSGFLVRESELLKLAYKRMPTLPFDEIDVLVVDRMGKNISGTGMDTNVTGRREYGFEPAPETPNVTRIFVRGITPPSHGNGTALGCADLIHADLYKELNLSDTLVNTLTGSVIRGARIPVPVETDRAGLVACLSTIGVTPPEKARVVRIRDTMQLEHIEVSPTLAAEARGRDDLEVVSEPEPVALNEGQYEQNVLGV